MDVLENILERIGEAEKQRDQFLKQAEEEDNKIGRLEQLYQMLGDPCTADLMREVVVGTAVQNGAAIPTTNGTEKNYVGMQRVRAYVEQIQPGATFTVNEVYSLSIAHRAHGDAKAQHPEFEKQRRASISVALSSMARGGDIETIKAGRGQNPAVYRRPEVRS